MPNMNKQMQILLITLVTQTALNWKIKNTRVVLGPDCGGRVLEYSWKNKNTISLDPAHDGWMYHADEPKIDPSGGRFDIGPENIILNPTRVFRCRHRKNSWRKSSTRFSVSLWLNPLSCIRYLFFNSKLTSCLTFSRLTSVL